MLLVSGHEAWYSTNKVSLKSSFDYNKKKIATAWFSGSLALTDSYILGSRNLCERPLFIIF